MVEKAAKNEILSRIREALGTPKQECESDYAYIPRQYHVEGQLDEGAKLALLMDRLDDYGSSVYECTEAMIPGAIELALRERKIRTVLTGKEFPGGWIPAGFDFHTDNAFNPHQLDRFECVITPCAIAIAETGTIVLRHAEDEPRRAVSLIPDYHLCIVFAQQVVQTVPEGVRQMAAMGSVPLTTISGPSATSDIEMTRIKGVHGPRTLDVILVRGG